MLLFFLFCACVLGSAVDYSFCSPCLIIEGIWEELALHSTYLKHRLRENPNHHRIVCSGRTVLPYTFSLCADRCNELMQVKVHTAVAVALHTASLMGHLEFQCRVMHSLYEYMPPATCISFLVTVGLTVEV